MFGKPSPKRPQRRHTDNETVERSSSSSSVDLRVLRLAEGRLACGRRRQRCRYYGSTNGQGDGGCFNMKCNEWRFPRQGKGRYILYNVVVLQQHTSFYWDHYLYLYSRSSLTSSQSFPSSNRMSPPWFLHIILIPFFPPFSSSSLPLLYDVWFRLLEGSVEKVPAQ